MLLRALWLVTWRSLEQHRLAGSITAFSIALATSLILTVSSLQFQAVKVFSGQTGGYDAVLGARGSSLQLVLCSLYHLENSPGNLSWDKVLAIRQEPLVSRAIPFALGDNYLGYRIVGTLSEYFSAWEPGFAFAQGGPFQAESQAVVGSWVAQRTGLRLGDRFHPFHGLNYDAGAQHEESYQVVGILEPTNTPQDRVIFIPLEGVFRMSGHVLRGQGQEFVPRAGQPIPEAAQEVSGVLLKLKSPQAGMHLDQLINRQGHSATLAWPIARIVSELFLRLEWLVQLMKLTTVLILVVAAASVSASLCNTLQERRREFAILRALGARRLFLSAVIGLESMLITLLGTFGGFCLYLGLMWLVTRWLRFQTGIQFDPWALHPGLVAVPAGALALGFLSGLLPTMLVYRRTLAPDLHG
ncbi:MAG: ABC transporter permease [Candidatus Eremiobacteraeota bacterium]|nr:ABC transporter permease [Candidatus Eremiobacteraeota bacterium]MCW5866932.1 ABC transporter permease [Candidatus Eremiobacteraeota bacterium]